MWYFAWMLGVTMAVLLASINAMMCDAQEYALDEARNKAVDDTRGRADRLFEWQYQRRMARCA
ncbi:MAG: cytochrome bd-I oxidase subunit CydX [Thiobacillus sp.]|nr:cytochrome bd-I oxidase subunit CydX [Thiobacillus sp.]